MVDGRRTGAGDAVSALAANHANPVAHKCDPGLDGIVVLGLSDCTNTGGSGRASCPGNRVIFRRAPLISAVAGLTSVSLE